MRSIIKVVGLGLILLTMVRCEKGQSTGLEVNEKMQKLNDSSELKKYAHLLQVSFVTGKFDPAKHEDFVIIDSIFSNIKGRYMHKDAYAAWVSMAEAAASDGVTLKIISAARNFEYQKGIWERKWNGQTILSDGTDASTIADSLERAKKILLYSSMPGTSRHHWGTDIDMNNFNNDYFEQGRGLAEYTWLSQHAERFGYHQPYTSKDKGRTGYEEEKWHWTYSPISNLLTSYAKNSLTNEMIDGFMGCEVADRLDVVSNYILGINPILLID